MIDEEGAITRRIEAERRKKEKAAESETKPRVRNSIIAAIEDRMTGYLKQGDEGKPIIAPLLKKRLTE